MTPADTERQIELLQRAKVLAQASELYAKAAAAVAANQPEEVRYSYVKSAKESIEEAFPEVFQVRYPAPKYVIKEERDYRVLKTIGIAALILGILFAFVKFGPTGDLSKTWSTDDVAKSTAYPR